MILMGKAFYIPCLTGFFKPEFQDFTPRRLLTVYFIRLLRMMFFALKGIFCENSRQISFITWRKRTMLAEFSTFPMGRGPGGLSKYVAESMGIIKESGLSYEVHALGTLVEGDADLVFEVIRKCHDNMLKHGERVITTIKIDDRKGASNRIKGKVESVERELGWAPPKGQE
jgi:uncharacterized protein (TIGR00106 family)